MPKKGYKQTKEHINKVSIIRSKKLKGRKRPPFSNEWKKRLSISAKNRIWTKEQRENLRLSRIGHKTSEETKKKISKGNINRYIKNPNLKKQISEKLKGSKSHLWRGGITRSGYSSDWNNILKDDIRKRDNYICQECGIHQDELIGRYKKLDVHHIDYNKYNCSPDNLIALCRECHIKTNQNREYWVVYFLNRC